MTQERQADLFAEYRRLAVGADWHPHHHARATDPDTSHAAAASMTDSAATLCERVLRCLLEHGPATQSEVGDRLGMLAHAANKRLSDLKNAGLIRPSGQTRPGPSGRRQTVWTSG